MAEPESGQASIIKAVTTPLNLFALVVLATEGILLVLANHASEKNQNIITYFMVGDFTGLMIIFLVLAVFKPQVFYSEASQKEGVEERRMRDAVLGAIGDTGATLGDIVQQLGVSADDPVVRVKINAALGQLRSKGYISEDQYRKWRRIRK